MIYWRVTVQYSIRHAVRAPKQCERRNTLQMPTGQNLNRGATDFWLTALPLGPQRQRLPGEKDGQQVSGHEKKLLKATQRSRLHQS